MNRPRMLNEKEKISTLTVVLYVVLLLAIIFMIFSLWFRSTYFVVTVQKHSMETTLFEGEVVYARYNQKAQRGDIVIINAPAFSEEETDEYLIIKRLIAVEGDCVKCENGVVMLKKAGEDHYEVLDEKYLDQNNPEQKTGSFEEVQVGEGEIFAMGDHRMNSKDSRNTLGNPLKEADIVGVVPEWALEHKQAIANWENFRRSLAGGK